MTAETSRHPSLDELSAWVDGEIGDAYEREVLAQHVADVQESAGAASGIAAWR